jgi:outer membrane biosynthesis protein TonB
MDPDTTLERLAMLSLDDKAKPDDNKEKDDEHQHDKEAPEEMPRHKKTWKRIPREVPETTDKEETQEEQKQQHEEEWKRYPERAWEEEGKYNSYHREHSAKWPRWRAYSTNKGTFTRHWEKTGDQSQNEEEVQNQSQSSSSNQVIENQESLTQNQEDMVITEASDKSKVYWDKNGVWEWYGGLWWKQNESGYWHRWEE